ncbi:DUF4258 domain-containing protein [Brucella tritici]|nr:DUF4258 domain-containing protein [Brucella tritici]
MIVTLHASERMQQRAIPRRVVEAIIQYGAGKIVRGAESIMLDRNSLKMVAETDSRLALHREGNQQVCYSPFDYVETSARLAIVGITPGMTQALNALNASVMQSWQSDPSWSPPYRKNDGQL